MLPGWVQPRWKTQRLPLLGFKAPTVFLLPKPVDLDETSFADSSSVQGPGRKGYAQSKPPPCWLLATMPVGSQGTPIGLPLGSLAAVEGWLMSHKSAMEQFAFQDHLFSYFLCYFWPGLTWAIHWEVLIVLFSNCLPKETLVRLESLHCQRELLLV